MELQKHSKKKWIILPIIFVIVGFAVLLVVQFVTKTGWFFVPGEVIYDSSLNAEELAELKQIFNEDVVLKNDVKVLAYESTTLPNLDESEQLTSIVVPVVDFYNTLNGISSATFVIEDGRYVFDAMVEDEVDWVYIDELDSSKRLLSLDGIYYLDALDGGAIFRVIKFESDNYKEEIAPLVEGKFAIEVPTKDTVLTLAQTGVTALSRGMLTQLNAVGGDGSYFAANIGEYLSGFDLTHTSNESSFTDYASSENICSDKRFTDTLLSIGLDIVELTGNHNQDCGDEAAAETIDWYEQNNIRIVGGGKNADLARRPLEIKQKNTGITFLAYNLSTGGATEDNTPGANQYVEEDAVAEIGAARARGDVVIVDVQYYECSEYVSETEDTTCDAADSAAGDQVGLFRHLIDLGADVVVGTSAHQPQTFEAYGEGEIYYGLGNLFFDQVWWPGTTRSLILAHYFYNGKLLQTKIVPTVYDKSMQTRLMGEEDAKWFIERLTAVRP